MEIEHKLTDVAYGVGRAQVPTADGVETRVVLKFARPDESESWVIPMSQKVADDIAKALSASRVHTATAAEVAKLGQ